MGAYALTDRAYLAGLQATSAGMAGSLSKGDPRLFNPYGVMPGERG